MSWTEEEYQEFMARTGKPQPPKKKSKYRNKRINFRGIYFDSQKESLTYIELTQKLKDGEIKGFCRQCEFILQEGTDDTEPIRYIADWVIFNSDGTYTIRDDKGFETEIFKIKHKMFKAKYPELKLEVVK